jgi:hypothetical protein
VLDSGTDGGLAVARCAPLELATLELLEEEVHHVLDALDLPRHAMHELRLVGERERGLALVDRLVEVLLHLLLERVARLRAARDLWTMSLTCVRLVSPTYANEMAIRA